MIINNGEIVFTYAEAKRKYKISNGQYLRAIKQLREYGFIDYKTDTFKEPNKFTLLDNWIHYGTDSFKELPPKHPRRTSCGFQKGNKLGMNCDKLDSIDNLRTDHSTATTNPSNN